VPELTAVLAMEAEAATRVLPPGLRRRLGSLARFDPDLVLEDFTDGRAAGILSEAEILITGWGCPLVDDRVLTLAPSLRAIFHTAGTVKSHLSAAVWERGIVVSSAARANAVPVAQFTVGATLLAGKRAFGLSRWYATGEHKSRAGSLHLGNEDRTVGIVGASLIGRLVMDDLRERGFRLLVADPYLDPAEAEILGARLVGLDDLVTGSDVVTLHAPALPETRHLMDGRRIALMRDGAVLINTARGTLIDTGALVDHCATGRIDAVLDVTDPTPLPLGHPLFALPNVFLTPHIAGAQGREQQRLGAFAVDEIERWACGEPLHGRVSAADLPRIA
jgi:phosphoglycerate dehydrogenase-like enzyme